MGLTPPRPVSVGAEVWVGDLSLVVVLLVLALVLVLVGRPLPPEPLAGALPVGVSVGALLGTLLSALLRALLSALLDALLDCAGGGGAGAFGGGVGETPKPGIDRVVTPGCMRRIGAGTGGGSWMGTLRFGLVCLRPRKTMSSSTVRGGRILNSPVRVSVARY